MTLHYSSRKIQEFGTSLALTIPSLYAKVRSVRKGETVHVIYCLDGVVIVSDLKDLNKLKTTLQEMILSLETMEIP